MPDQRRLLALRHGLAVDLGDEVDEPLRLVVSDTVRLANERTVVAHDRNEKIRCVSIDSCDKDGWPPEGWRPQVSWRTPA